MDHISDSVVPLYSFSISDTNTNMLGETVKHVIATGAPDIVEHQEHPAAHEAQPQKLPFPCG
jgi:hypothetical protein